MMKLQQMNSMPLQWLIYHFRRWGWQGQLAMVVVLISVVMAVIAYLSLVDAQQLRTQVSQLNAQPVIQQPPAQRPIEMTQRFYRALPQQTEANQHIASLLQAIDAHGLLLDRSEYATKIVPQSRLVRYQIQLPLRGQYPQIRRFVTEVMNGQPSLALSSISFVRETAGSEFINTHIEFVLFTRATGQ